MNLYTTLYIQWKETIGRICKRTHRVMPFPVGFILWDIPEVD